MTKVEFRVLGPFEVRVEGRALELKRRKQRALLALLMLNAGEVVSTDRLIEELWAGKPPKAAVGSVQNLVSDLRKALGRECEARIATEIATCKLSIGRDKQSHQAIRLACNSFIPRRRGTAGR